MKIAEIMTREVVTVPPEASLKQAAGLLVEHRVSGLPVVEAEGRLLGVVSEADVLHKERGGVAVPAPLAWLAGFDAEVDRSKLDARLVREAMTAPALTIGAGEPVSRAARLMGERGVNRLPVVEDGELVGIVTRADLVRAFIRSDAEIEDEIRSDLAGAPVQVRVEEGVVTLEGELESRSDMDRLVELVADSPGVVAVRSELRVNRTETGGGR